MESTIFPEYNEEAILEALKRYLPAQAPLKDFVFQNTLAGFQDRPFFKALQEASSIFGYNVYLSIEEFRSLYSKGTIREACLDRVIAQKKGVNEVIVWKEKLLNDEIIQKTTSRIGQLRNHWASTYKIELGVLVYPILFRTLSSYLDQGVSDVSFPIYKKEGFFASVVALENDSYISFFTSKRVKNLLKTNGTSLTIEQLLTLIVGDSSYFSTYLFDQQFSHPGWSGMVAGLEQNATKLYDPKLISLKDAIIFELLLELDVLDTKLGKEHWKPISRSVLSPLVPLFSPLENDETQEFYELFQEAYEWSYFDEVLNALKGNSIKSKKPKIRPNFQVLFCIDDRECSLRRYIENEDPTCETFGTPGFFNVEFYFQPEDGKFYTKLCPDSIQPKYLIKELDVHEKRLKEVHFKRTNDSLLKSWITSQILGFWSAIKLVTSIFNPTISPTSASSFKHMNQASRLTIVNTDPSLIENGLQVGFSIEEMALRVEQLLRSIGLIKEFAPIVYIIGHGSSSVNNPYYSTMDCGACSCKPGSVNARVFSFMANHPEVRKRVAEKGINIPLDTQFEGGLHDTTRDEMMFFDEEYFDGQHLENHLVHVDVFKKALEQNAKERSRRFDSIDSYQSAKKIHSQIKTRSVSIFEPRPELDHVTNALAIIGSRALTAGIFFDRRAFLNSYAYQTDLEGKLLYNVLLPIGPVCGGINLNYYFSRVDNEKLGASSKLPHNVMGLIGVSNGTDGDLRPGLPSQMVELHDPIRLMVIIEHFPSVIEEVLKKSTLLSNWYANEWMYLVACEPETKKLYYFKQNHFVPYEPLSIPIPTVAKLDKLLETSDSRVCIPVHYMKK